ncbi:hypothetical protein B0E53_01161 [Micromonospora sp. MH33]|nr:hypothetical protein B0E53_01161 [Micromonospora sp. MH33]
MPVSSVATPTVTEALLTAHRPTGEIAHKGVKAPVQATRR